LLGRQGAEALAGALRSTPLLRHLDLSGTHELSVIRDPAAVALAPQLGALTRLTTRDLKGARVGAAGVRALAARLSALADLKPREWAQQGSARAAVATALAAGRLKTRGS
jgi:hypothetical protein